MKTKQSVLLVLLLSLIFSHSSVVYAGYVLPYPSYMPGNKMYAISRVADKLKEYWHWGNIASFRYQLGLSDKYLVEAKTLFEYKQYPLAIDALKRSGGHFEKVTHFLKNAKDEGKDISQLKRIIEDAADVHIRVLEQAAGALPDEFEWRPEKTESTVLPIGTLIREAKALRRAVKDVSGDL